MCEIKCHIMRLKALIVRLKARVAGNSHKERKILIERNTTTRNKVIRTLAEIKV